MGQLIVPNTAKNESAQVTGFFSPKGGTGQSFLIVNLAVALKALGKRVLVYDADTIAPQACYLAHTEEPENFSDFERGQITLQSLIQRGLGGIDVLSLGNTLGLDPKDVYQSLHGNLGDVFSRYDEVLIDIPTKNPEIQKLFLPLVDRAVAVCSADGLAQRILGSYLKNLEVDKVEWEILFNQVQNPLQAGELYTQLQSEISQKKLGLKTSLTGYVVSDSKRVLESITKRTPCSLLDQSGSLSGCFTHLASGWQGRSHRRGRSSFIDHFLKNRGV